MRPDYSLNNILLYHTWYIHTIHTILYQVYDIKIILCAVYRYIRATAVA